MIVGFRYSDIWNEFGDSDLLHAFFSTICYHLEDNNWGSKYPYVQKNYIMKNSILKKSHLLWMN